MTEKVVKCKFRYDRDSLRSDLFRGETDEDIVGLVVVPIDCSGVFERLILGYADKKEYHQTKKKESVLKPHIT